MIASQSASWHGKAWVSPGFGVFLGQVGNHDWHRHMAHQITIGINRDLTVTTSDSHVTARAICIHAGVTHRIEAVEVISIYLDALSEEARAVAALQLITAGQSLTGAAHAAGFSDSAHFSRTFRSLFGLDPSSALSQVSLSS
ncbi:MULTISPECIES: helix-turn-helix domain-containing protein [Pseudomonadaceae]|uniref:helix-turn-helix domain-containing protein n=1 Tax=Pseudomonadaceae TaxID=135621 RepID=UPI001F3C6A30|nr:MULTISPECIES: helix-turn-helix domain-containing protein [Pseudomonas]MCO7552415.1 helix-turn-helix domain-containing protein [Pseudomonas otitidis]